MMMFVIFLIVNVGTIGIFYGVYGTKRKYEEGMLMGVHLPGSAAESEEVKMLMKKYRTWTKWFYTLNLLAGIAVCGFCFWYMMQQCLHNRRKWECLRCGIFCFAD